MFGKRKNRDRPPRGSGTNQTVIPPGLRLRLIKAFLTDLPPGSGFAPSATPPVAVAPPGGSLPPPVGSPGLATGPFPAPPPLRGPTQIGDFLFEITPLVGPENRAGNNPDMTIPLPGVGPVRVSQLKAALGRLNAVVAELTGGADITDGLAPAQLQAAADRLEAMHTAGRLTTDQYQALAELGVALMGS